MATEIQANNIYKPNYLSINLLPLCHKYMFSVPTIIYAFSVPYSKFSPRMFRNMPLPSSVRTITCLSEAAKQVSSFHLVHKYISNHFTAIDVSSQSSRAIRRREITLNLLSKLSCRSLNPCLGMAPAEPRLSLNFQGITAAKLPCAAHELTAPHAHLYFDLHPTPSSINF